VGWLAEFAGVHTGLLFGSYAYGETLGLSLLGIPLLMGLLWASLIHAANALLAPLAANIWFRALLCGALLVTLDVQLEPVAMRLGFWQWHSFRVPLQNYVGWFVTGIFLSWASSTLSPPKPNSLAAWYFGLQLAFFFVLRLGLQRF